jgi:fatty acid kinase fatty acid binding subunit
MSAVAICTDSSALFPAGVAERLGVSIVPLVITLDGVPVDERAIAPDDFYARLDEGAEVTTSQPSPGVFLTTYARLAEAGVEEVLSIHLDARLSGTVGSAELAAREALTPVTVVDTRTVSFGVGLCVRRAAEAIAAGATADEAAVAAAGVAATLGNVFVAQRAPGGRLPDTAGWALLEFADGKAETLGAPEDNSDVIDAMVARVLADERSLTAAVGHAGASTQPVADALAIALASLSQVAGVERYRVGPAVGAHTGPLSFGAFWWPSWSG